MSTFSFENNDTMFSRQTVNLPHYSPTMSEYPPKQSQEERDASMYLTPSDRQTVLSDEFVCMPLLDRQRLIATTMPPPAWISDSCGSEAGDDRDPSDHQAAMGDIAITSTPVNLTSLITALRTTVQQDSPPVILDLLDLQGRSDFERPSLRPDHQVGACLCRPSLRPKAEVQRSRATRIAPARPALRQDHNLAALLKGLPEMPDTTSLTERRCLKLKPRTSFLR